ncbi:HAD family hydrolase [Thermodesulfatator autotrophicus]|uniref:phosphoglycolate phosphatase n=1 Tax=Thermodesulfatator autotrophicus TaxID=1795632 RepID=A0A177E4F2_9BACT|nr:HAD family hydrolase [Thermodesulfatator autotrophicus]OAG26834.1 hypothetical protein TH606_10245 [Thermodesulfatator autotrophicus]
MSAYKAIIFDVDGTLYYQAPLRRKMLKELLLSFIFNPLKGYREIRLIKTFREEREKLRHFSPGKDTLLEELQYLIPAQKLGISPQEVKKVIKDWIFEKPLKHLRACKIPGLDEFLALCKAQGLKTGIFSDYPASQKLETLGILQHFDLVLCATSPEINAFKPSPKGLKVTMEKLGLGPQEILYVGDRLEVDGLCAERAGVSFVLISPGAKKISDFLQVEDYFSLLQIIFGPKN